MRLCKAHEGLSVSRGLASSESERVGESGVCEVVGGDEFVQSMEEGARLPRGGAEDVDFLGVRAGNESRGGFDQRSDGVDDSAGVPGGEQCGHQEEHAPASQEYPELQPEALSEVAPQNTDRGLELHVAKTSPNYVREVHTASLLGSSEIDSYGCHCYRPFRRRGVERVP